MSEPETQYQVWLEIEQVTLDEDGNDDAWVVIEGYLPFAATARFATLTEASTFARWLHQVGVTATLDN